MMRIGIVVYGSLDILTGGYLYDRIVVEGLRGLGHEVEVVSLPAGPYLLRLGRGLLPVRPARLAAGSFDLLLEDELCHPSLLLVNRGLKRGGGPPLVAIVHHALCSEPRSLWKNRLYALAERGYLASVDGFVFNSQTTRRTVETMLGRRKPHVVAAPAGNRFDSLPSREDIGARARRPGPLQLLFLGNVVPRKGLLPLLEALSPVERSGWRLTVAGSPAFAPEYAARARELVRGLGLDEAVRFLGPLSQDELARVLAASQVLCMPYAFEGFGIAILEAMAFGLPAIGCRAGAAGEIIRPGENGFLLAANDQQGLGPVLAELHHRRGRLAHMALEARKTYDSRPTWQDGVAAIDRFLRGLPK